MRWTMMFFFFNDTATTEIYPLSLHDALPIWCVARGGGRRVAAARRPGGTDRQDGQPDVVRRGRHLGRDPAPRRRCRSEEHTSELQSQSNLVCRLLLEKKKTDRPLPTLWARSD